jgi:hypothetical protein
MRAETVQFLIVSSFPTKGRARRAACPWRFGQAEAKLKPSAKLTMPPGLPDL